MHGLTLIVTLLLTLTLVTSQPLPQWPNCYLAKGIIRLPYAELEEPFTAYYEAKRNRSRIDYYDVMQTYQLGGDGIKDFGRLLKVAPMTTEEFLNVKTCFQVNGSVSNPVTIQTLLPDLTGFNVTGKKVVDGQECYIWQNITQVFGKRNVYTLWQNVKTGLPVRYEMMGYDSLLGSHYDKYYVDYVDISPQESLSDDIFTVPANLTCGNFPGPGINNHHRHHQVSVNPMREFLHQDDSHTESSFEHFKKTHQKDYKDHLEHEEKKHNFRHNLRYINSKNRAGLTYQLAINRFADMSDAELRTMRTCRKSSPGYNGGLPFDKSKYNMNDIPEHIDWRLYGAVTQVKDQAICGSCWSFGTAGVVEGAHFMKTGQLVRLSQQELIDCSWGEGNNGCDGGEDFRAYNWIMKHGLASEESYGQYLGVDGNCNYKSVTPTAYMKGFVNVTSGDVDALKVAIAKFGPVSVGIDAAHRSLSFYANGVYYEPNCGSRLEDLDHAVLAVGYGVLNDEPYWLIKNSWSTYWGNDGYVLMSQKNNNCGVATSATYVLM